MGKCGTKMKHGECRLRKLLGSYTCTRLAAPALFCFSKQRQHPPLRKNLSRGNARHVLITAESRGRVDGAKRTVNSQEPPPRRPGKLCTVSNPPSLYKSLLGKPSNHWPTRPSSFPPRTSRRRRLTPPSHNSSPRCTLHTPMRLPHLGKSQTSMRRMRWRPWTLGRSRMRTISS